MEDGTKVKFAIFRRFYFVFTSLKTPNPRYFTNNSKHCWKSPVKAEYSDMNFVVYQREISYIFQYSPPLYFNTLILKYFFCKTVSPGILSVQHKQLFHDLHVLYLWKTAWTARVWCVFWFSNRKVYFRQSYLFKINLVQSSCNGLVLPIVKISMQH